MTSREESRAAAKVVWRQGIRNTSRAAILTRVNKRTMQRYFKKLRHGRSLHDKSRSGRPRKLTTTLRRRLGQIKSRMPYAIARYYADELRRISGESVSVTSVKTALHQLGYNWRLPSIKRLTSSQKQARVDFARIHLQDSWDKRWNLDQASFNLYRRGNRYWVRLRTSDAEDEPSKPKLTGAQEKISITICVAITAGRKSALAILPKNYKSSDFIKEFDSVILPSLRWTFSPRNQNELMLDNDGRHRTAEWRDYVARKRLRLVRPWPSNSPDLAPVENVFAWMKKFVEDARPRSEPTLRHAIEMAWMELPVEFTENAMHSIPQRLALVLRRRGGHTGY